MKHVKCPEESDGGKRSVFLAGGITGCEDWQDEIVEMLKDTNFVLLNPRR